MDEPLPDGGMIRKLWIGETDAYRDHLLRLTAKAGAGAFPVRFPTTSSPGMRRRPKALGWWCTVSSSMASCVEPPNCGVRLDIRHEGEAAFSIEQPWQSHGVGTVLLERTLLSARNRGIKSLQMLCLADNQRMQQLARKFEADLKFDFGSVVGEVDPPRYTTLSLMREAIADGHGIATAMLDGSVTACPA